MLELGGLWKQIAKHALIFFFFFLLNRLFKSFTAYHKGKEKNHINHVYCDILWDTLCSHSVTSSQQMVYCSINSKTGLCFCMLIVIIYAKTYIFE